MRCRSDAKVTALVGPSGSGKTSLIESIAGLRSASGRIVIDSISLAELPPERRRIGYVPQDVVLFPHLSVRDNIFYGGRDRGRFDSLCHTLELVPLLDRSPTTLSGGERQRVAIARALMTDPRLLLLDEPLASVDQPLRERVLMYLRRVRDLDVPMIYVTHQQFEAVALSSWCIVLRDGRVAAEGRPREILFADPSPGALENVLEVSNPRHEPEKGITRVMTSDGLELVLPHDRVADVAFPLIVRISAEDDHLGWRVAVSDQGPGIAPDRVAQLFNAFSRGETHGQPGVGLGLTIASQAARLLGGELVVDSQVGKGSTFSFQLPAARPEISQ